MTTQLSTLLFIYYVYLFKNNNKRQQKRVLHNMHLRVILPVSVEKVISQYCSFVCSLPDDFIKVIRETYVNSFQYADEYDVTIPECVFTCALLALLNCLIIIRVCVWIMCVNMFTIAVTLDWLGLSWILPSGSRVQCQSGVKILQRTRVTRRLPSNNLYWWLNLITLQLPMFENSSTLFCVTVKIKR